MSFDCGVMQTVKEFIEKVKAGGNKDVSLYMYPGEGHGFMNGGKDIHEKMKSKLVHDFTGLHGQCQLDMLWLLGPQL